MLIQNEQQQQQPQAKQPKQQQQQQKLTAIDAGCSSSRSRQRESRRRIMSISFYAVRQCPNYLPPSLSPAHSHALPFAATAAKAKKKLSYALTRRCCQAASLSLCALALFAVLRTAAPHCVAPNCVQPRSFCVAPHCARPHACPFCSAHSALSAAAGIPLTLPSYVCNCSCIYSYMLRAR